MDQPTNLRLQFQQGTAEADKADASALAALVLGSVRVPANLDPSIGGHRHRRQKWATLLAWLGGNQGQPKLGVSGPRLS